MTDDHLATNLDFWEQSVPVHVAAPSYAVERLIADPTLLSDVVAFDERLMGRLDGLDAVHLQCHIGTDTVSLARLGARSVTGYDFSAAAVAAGRDLAARAAQANVSFVEGELYDAPSVLGEQRFDLVYTGVGALCWLPDIAAWARVVAALLRPGGRLHVRDGHPMLMALEDDLSLTYPYDGGPVRFDDAWPDYADPDTVIDAPTVEFHHGLGSIVNAVIAAGLEITGLTEHDSVPWNALPGLMTELADLPGEYRLSDRPERLAHTFTLTARLSGSG